MTWKAVPARRFNDALVLGRVIAALLAFAVRTPPAVAGPNALPAWLVVRPGTIARVDVAPWPAAGEPEAALTQSAASMDRDFTGDAQRPGDVVYEPIGVRVRVVRTLPSHRLVLVHGLAARWEAYTTIDRLVPEIPAGTRLSVAGGFGGFGDFFASLDTPQQGAERLATGTKLLSLAMGSAPYDPASSDLVRVRVHVISGNLRGRSGWLSVAYTGLPVSRIAAGPDVASKACACRLTRFEGKGP